MGFTTWAFFLAQRYMQTMLGLTFLRNWTLATIPDGERGTGMGRQGTFPPPLHPMGTEIAPRELNTYQIHPLMDEIPVGDRGSGCCHPYT